MTPELLAKKCGQCGQWLSYEKLPTEHRHGFAALYENQPGCMGIAIFTSHTAANAAARAAGWTVQSESIGGDVCEACLEERDPQSEGESID